MSAYRLPAPHERTPLNRRASGLAFALAINALLLLLLLTSGRFRPDSKGSHPLDVSFVPELMTPPPAPPPPTSVPTQRPKAPTEERPKVVQPAMGQRSFVPLPAPPAPTSPTPAIPISPAPAPVGSTGALGVGTKAGSGGSGGDGLGSGAKPGAFGPNVTLYQAEWARQPTRYELARYVPNNAHNGFGQVACKVISHLRVTDCVELDETPGSHLAAAVRQAAWQFRVRPPRKDGVPLIGAWVVIRIDYDLGRRRF